MCLTVLYQIGWNNLKGHGQNLRKQTLNHCSCMRVLSHVQLLQPYGLQPARLLSMGFFPARTLEGVAIPSSRGSS